MRFRMENKNLFCIILFIVYLIIGSAIACEKEVDPDFVKRIDTLIRAGTTEKELDAMAEIVRYARKHDISYGYQMRNKHTGEIIDPGELEHHLKEKIIVTIYIGSTEPYQEMIWEPSTNRHITRLVIH